MSHFQIDIENAYRAVSVDGKQLRLTASPRPGQPLRFKNSDPYLTSLRDLNSTLRARKVYLPWELETFGEAENVIRKAVEQSGIVDVTDAPEVELANGEFQLVYNVETSQGGGRDWTLTNPARTVARLTASGYDEVGFYPNAYSAIWKAVERKLFARTDVVVYQKLATVVLEVAQGLLGDLKVVKR